MSLRSLLVVILIPVLAAGQSADYVSGQALVQLQPGIAFHALQVSVAENNTPTDIDFRLVKTVSRRMNIYLVAFDETVVNERDMISRLNGSQIARAAQLNHRITLRDSMPDDPQYTTMWDLNAASDKDIDAPEAWGITTGGWTYYGDTIVVADVDNGFDLNHEDINFWKNYNDIPGDTIDNDGNGYLNDYDGWNAYDTNGVITSSYHGTHTAGTIGAKGNNGVGITGIGWNTQVMPIMGSTGDEATVLQAYGYALEMRAAYNDSIGQGAFVVATNSSFGVDFGQPADFPLWCAMYDSLGAHGILSAGATANLNIDVDNQGDIPTACVSDFLITATNTTSSDVRYTGAGYGDTTIDLGAPGTNTYSTTPGNSYGTSTGTSMATPHVTGAIGLVYGLPCQAFADSVRSNPAGTALMVKSFILAGVDTLDDLVGKTVSGGRLNLFRTLKLALFHYGCDTAVTHITSTGYVDNPFIKFSVYPSPTAGDLSMEWFALSGTDARIAITNTFGQTLSTKAVHVTNSLYQDRFDVSAFPTGVYVVSVADATGKQLSKTKFVKQD